MEISVKELLMNKLLLLLCVLVLTAVVPNIVFAESYVQWIDFSVLKTPVDRPVEQLAASGKATYCTGNFQNSITHEEGNLAAKWEVELKNPSAKASGIAALRTVLHPMTYFKQPDNTTVGVRIHLNSSKATELDVEVFEKVNAVTGFWSPAKRIGVCKKQLRAGKQKLLLLWRDTGVKNQDFSKVQGYGLVTPQAPLTVDIYKVDMIFACQADADNFCKQRDDKLRQLQQTAIGTLTPAGIDLNPLFGKLAIEKMEAVIWQGYQLVAMDYQLKHWMPLAVKHYGKDEDGKLLCQQRQKLAAEVVSGNLPQSQIDKLQLQIDSYVDNLLNNLPLDARRWKIVKDGFGLKPNGRPYDGRYYRPDGRPYRLFAPYFQRIRYASPSPKKNTFAGWKSWDMRHFAALGFNGARMDISWHRLEPVQGEFDRDYLNMVRQIFKEAEKYGLGICVDLHWGFPKWFMAGKPGTKVSKDKCVNTNYHWPEAMVETWQRLAAELADVPNIVAFEVPNNEPVVSFSQREIIDTETLQRSWNDWLKRRYHTRQDLDDNWASAVVGSGRYKLAADENWDNASIKPLGFQDDPDQDTAYSYNPRLWDHLKWVGWMQTDLTTKIMKAIRKSFPQAVGIMQRTMGDRHDKSSVPLFYHSIQTVTGEHVVPGTHYAVGGFDAHKAASETLLSYDSEQQMYNMDHPVQSHVEKGLGFSPFSYFFFGTASRLLLDYQGHLRPDVAFLSRRAGWIRSHWPEPETTGTRVAIISNTRLEATTGSLVIDLTALLKEQHCRVGLFEGLRIVQHPEFLNGYDIVITTSNYMDVDLLDILDKQFKGSVLLFGRLDLDSYARKSDKGLTAELAKRAIFLKNNSVSKFSESESGRIDLTGAWDWYFAGKHQNDPVVPLKNIPDDDYKQITAPGVWGELKMLGSRDYRIGDGWYRRKVVIPAAWKGQALQLIMGAIDDEDWTFLNGHLIGKTTSDTPNCYAMARKYNIPSQIVRWGQENELFICNLNTYGIAGITKGPVEIIAAQKTEQLCWVADQKDSAKAQAVRVGNEATRLGRADILDDVEVLARIGGDSQDNPAAVIKQGRWFWWVMDSPWSKDSQTQKTVLGQIFEKMPK